MFSKSTALDMARFSQWAYGPTVGKSDDFQCVAVGPLEHVCLIVKDGRPTFAFRGSYSFADWLSNFDAILDNGQRTQFLFGGGVHQGVFDLLDRLIGWVLSTAEKLPSGPINITGHSLGGGLATLAAKWLQVRGYFIGNVYTLGSPRVLSHRAARHAVPQYRCVHDLDLVPHLPLAWPYKHVGQTVLFQDGNVYENDTWRYWASSLMKRFWKVPVVDIQNHMIRSYIEALR